MRRIVAVAVMTQALGCSFALVSGPPANHQQLPYFECTTSKVGPVLDTVWTSLQALNLLVAASASDQEWDENFDGDPPFGRSTAIPLYLGLAALGGAGMYYGFTRTSACKGAKQEQIAAAIVSVRRERALEPHHVEDGGTFRVVLGNLGARGVTGASGAPGSGVTAGAARRPLTITSSRPSSVTWRTSR